MMDLHTRLERLAGPIEPASAEVIDADLTRGRSAVRRRRAAQAVAGSAFGIAAIVAAFSFTGATVGESPGKAPTVAESATGGLKLVDYRGDQPRYFTVDKVPVGFFIQNDDEGGLTIAPDQAGTTGPGADPRNLTGKIGIYLEQAKSRGTVDGGAVTVAGHRAVLHQIGSTTQLVISVSPEVYATIQFDVPLSREQMLELGAGLHVHQEAIDRMARVTGKGPGD